MASGDADWSVSKGSLLGMGNPLLDLSATVDPQMLTQYNLKANDAILYEKEDLYEQLLKEYKESVEYTAGGATLNSIRIAQWILDGVSNKKADGATVYFGAVGDDGVAETLKQCSQKDGVHARYQVKKDEKTGKCAVLITGTNRSLVTKLDAANHFESSHLEPNWEVVERAKVFYSAGFFLTVSPDSMEKVAKHALEKNKTFALNLSAPFLPQFFSDPLMRILKLATLLFGNESEAEAFAIKNEYPEPKNARDVAKRIADIPVEGEPSKKRTVVITQGADNVIVVQNGKISEFKVAQLGEGEIVDTNGAGDAFVGGFLAQLIVGSNIERCVKCGIWAATEVIKRSGVTFPKDKAFDQ